MFEALKWSGDERSAENLHQITVGEQEPARKQTLTMIVSACFCQSSQSFCRVWTGPEVSVGFPQSCLARDEMAAGEL